MYPGSRLCRPKIGSRATWRAFFFSSWFDADWILSVWLRATIRVPLMWAQNVHTELDHRFSAKAVVAQCEYAATF